MALSPEQFLQELKAGALRPVYYFFGEDGAARAGAVQKLKESVAPDPFNLNELEPAQAEDVVSAANTPPVFADRRLVIVRGARILADARKALAAYLGDPLPSTTLVLQSDDRRPEPRDPLADAATRLGGVVVFEPLREDEAAARLTAEARKAGVALAEGAAEAIVEEAGTHWGILRAELDKLLLYCGARKTLGREDALACLGYRQAANPFDLPKLVLARKRAEALALVGRLLEEGVSEFQMLAGLSRELGRLLRIRRMRGAGLPEAQIFRELRLHSFYGREAIRQAEATPEAKLVRGLKSCVETEAALKSRSWLDPQIELERLVARLTA
ncbi:MAG: DNA polymerase III subunit delta [Elusimicrobia bacterium]|nr:DNA polymerase III subunit delta [Elusimicrobiota bacterium]